MNTSTTSIRHAQNHSFETDLAADAGSSALASGEPRATRLAATAPAYGGAYVTTDAPRSQRAGSYVTTAAPSTGPVGTYVTTLAQPSDRAGSYVSRPELPAMEWGS